MSPQSMPQPIQQTMSQQMQFSSGAPVQPNNPVPLEWYSEQQQQQQMNHPNAIMNAGQQQFPQLPGLTVGPQQNHSSVAVPVLQQAQQQQQQQQDMPPGMQQAMQPNAVPQNMQNVMQNPIQQMPIASQVSVSQQQQQVYSNNPLPFHK